MRLPVAEGFYEQEKGALARQVDSLLDTDATPKKCLGIIVPHAGYMFSGRTAGKTYSAADTRAKKFCLLGPNHTGLGKPVALSQQEWKTPLGVMKPDKGLSSVIPVNEEAHAYEHSIEVQLPFIQRRFGNPSIIPICLSDMPIEEMRDLASKIASPELFYVASSDFTHFGPDYGYVPQEKPMPENLDCVKGGDMKAIDLICSIEPEKFHDYVKKTGITICGHVAITIFLFICRNLGAGKGELIDYSTSYETMHGRSFVSYAGIAIR